MMPARTLGARGPAVSAIGLGCMGMSQFYGPRDDAESARTIALAREAGVTLFDTADMYGPYLNERLVGRAVAPFRHEIVIVTKFGNMKDGSGEVVGVNGRPEYVRQACEGSLRRLGVEVIDLYLQHRVDRATPVEETWGTLGELAAEGKIRWAGLCEARLDTIRRAHATHPVTAVQTELSLFSRDPRRGLLTGLAELGIGFMAYAPLSRGLLSGGIGGRADLTADDWRLGLPRFATGAIERNAALAAELARFARSRDLTIAQLAIAWVLAQGGNVQALTGTRRRSHLTENLRAALLTLSAADLAEIDAITGSADVAGDRYPDMSHVDA